MSGGLVERLRGINRNYDLARGIHCDIREAADRIEALEAQAVQMREALERIASGQASGPRGIDELPNETVWRELGAIRDIARQALAKGGAS